MPKQKRITALTSYDAIFERFYSGNMLKTDYMFIASMIRQFKESIEYRIIKAHINASITSQLRNPKGTAESAKDLGRLEGLDAIFPIIDRLSKFDEEIPKDEKEEEEQSFDQERILANDSASIVDVE